MSGEGSGEVSWRRHWVEEPNRTERLEGRQREQCRQAMGKAADTTGLLRGIQRAGLLAEATGTHNGVSREGVAALSFRNIIWLLPMIDRLTALALALSLPELNTGPTLLCGIRPCVLTRSPRDLLGLGGGDACLQSE